MVQSKNGSKSLTFTRINDFKAIVFEKNLTNWSPARDNEFFRFKNFVKEAPKLFDRIEEKTRSKSGVLFFSP